MKVFLYYSIFSCAFSRIRIKWRKKQSCNPAVRLTHPFWKRRGSDLDVQWVTEWLGGSEEGTMIGGNETWMMQWEEQELWSFGEWKEVKLKTE